MMLPSQDSEAREIISEAIHAEWLSWALAIAPELKELTRHHIPYGDSREQGNCCCKTCQRIARWEQEMFKPYAELTDGVKSYDRVWANKILSLIEKLGYHKGLPESVEQALNSGNGSYRP